jgi:hypothetical protein
MVFLNTIKMKRKSQIGLTLVASLLTLNSFSKEVLNQPRSASHPNQTLDNACSPATTKTDMDVNNVRAKILTGGDMWWDLISAKYEVPKGGGASSIFAGSLWIGGLDAGGQLKVAAQTYRQNGNDFWPGPLDTVAVSITADQCQKWDFHALVYLKDVEQFKGWITTPTDPLYIGYTIPLSITNWPAHGDPAHNQAHYLAPFYDANGDGIYEPTSGDYPAYDLTGTGSCGWRLYGDETLWWVFNDKGNIHTETGAQAIGLEVQSEAFAFSTNDEINNMTFYKYKIINRSSYAMQHTWFGQWIDMDLGKYDDDYVGCDVGRGLGYTYNGALCDGTGAPGQYGCQPPACGCDFFEGPLADPFDGIDNNRNGVVDEPGEQIIMSQFLYYNNDFNPVNGNPRNGTQYYNYLKGYWGNGTHMTYGGNGVGTGVNCDFMFPGNSDPTGWGTNRVPQPVWSEATANNTPGDRRFLQSAGQFTLQPGAVNYITTGIVWARATAGGPAGSVSLMRLVDDKAQALFDNCFKVLNGPDAPDLTIQELDRQLIIRLSNQPAPISNNYLEKYAEYDPQIAAIDTFNFLLKDTFNFEGYQIFQCANAQVSASDLDNVDKSRLIAQCDVKNGVARIVNFVPNSDLGGAVPQEMVVGADAGIQHTFNITQDLFAQNDRVLIDNKTYYYIAVAYGYNQYMPYAQDVPFNPGNVTAANVQTTASLAGQKQPYKRGRRNIRQYSAIPHKPAPQAGGTIMNSSYGLGPKITRIDGNGNGGNFLDLTDASTASILAAPSPHSRFDQVQYNNNAGPITVMVVDPLNVPANDFTISFSGALAAGVLNGASTWTIVNNTTGQSIPSDKSISIINEQVFPQWGISVNIAQVTGYAYSSVDTRYDVVGGTMTFTDNTKPWLSGVPDQDGSTDFNWIRSGTTVSKVTTGCNSAYDSYQGSVSFIDANEEYQKILGGTWAPYRLCAYDYSDPSAGTLCNRNGPAFSNVSNLGLTKMANLPSIDIVITSDKSKWTRSPVLELADQSALAEQSANKLDLRKGNSVDKNGNQNFGASTDNNDYPTGMGWFPGYAINVETGERLNIAFGEDSWLTAYHGRDMMWNPTADLYDQSFNEVWGGKHYIYVFGHNGKYFSSLPNTGVNSNSNVPAYDGGKYIHDKLATLNVVDKRNVYKDCAWVGIPLVATGEQFMATDVKIRLRIARPYIADLNVAADSAAPVPNTTRPQYKFTTRDLATQTNSLTAAKNALALINIVPNPYFAYSEYETDQLDNRVKITNLPGKCTINIYTISGTLVRQYKKDNEVTYQDWDIKNTAGIPVASGLYIIHVDVPGVGERILKWFGVARPIDLDSF